MYTNAKGVGDSYELLCLFVFALHYIHILF